jgi:hypothetical protein
MPGRIDSKTIAVEPKLRQGYGRTSCRHGRRSPEVAAAGGLSTWEPSRPAPAHETGPVVGSRRHSTPFDAIRRWGALVGTQLAVELWFDHEPVIDLETIGAMLRESYPGVTLLSRIEDGQSSVQFPADVNESCPAPDPGDRNACRDQVNRVARRRPVSP